MLVHKAIFGFTALLAVGVSSTAMGTAPNSKIRQRIYSLELQEKIAKKQEAERFHEILRTAKDPAQKSMAALALGIYYLDIHTKLSAQYFSVARTLTTEEDGSHLLARYYQARIMFNHGLYREAAFELKAFADKVADKQLAKAIQEMTAETLFHQGRFQEFAAAFESYAAEHHASRRNENLTYLAAQAHLNLGNKDKYFSLLETLASNFPMSEHSKWGLRQLLAHNEKKEYAFSLEFLRRLNRYADVDANLKSQLLALLEQADIRLKTGEVKNLSAYERIQALVRVREYEKALDLTTELYESNSLSEGARLGLISWMARLHHITGRYEQAAKYFEMYTSLASQAAPTNLYLLEAQARNYSKMGEFKKAADSFAEIAKITSSRSAKWQEFWNRYLGGEYERTMDIIQTADNVVTHDPFEPMVSEYWRGKILLRKGKQAEAMATFRKIVEEQPDSYYATILQAQFPSLNPAPVVPVVNEKGKVALGSTSNVLNMLREDLSQIEVLERYADAFEQKPAQFAARDHVNPTAIQPQPQLVGLAVQVPKNNDNQASSGRAWKASYPLAFNYIVDPMADALEMDKFLILSIMRAESYYNEHALSPVGARGLMQIMPYTALRIAAELEDNQFSVENMADPKVNISYGAYYLKNLLTYYNNNYFLAIAAYNAGPTAVDSWLKNIGPATTDEFVEAIPYEETRRYVKKVVRYLNQYHKIHKGANQLPLPEIPTERPQMAMF